MLNRWNNKLADFHRDQRGSISILSVFAVLILTMLLGMVMNVGRHVDGKIRMQNAADAVAYSGGVVVAREMNTLSFTNHLLCDVFALTAFLREARDRNSARYTSDVLQAWTEIGGVFEGSSFPKFKRLGTAIKAKVPLEQSLVQTYSDWAAAASERILPVMEEILRQEMIPNFQRDVVRVYPDIAQMAALEIAQRDARPNRGRGPMIGFLWRASGLPLNGSSDASDPAFPVFDPATGGDHSVPLARDQRQNWAETYLHRWNDDALYAFDREAKMSQFGSLWRSFTCAYLKKLLDEEYHSRNLPHLLRYGREDQDHSGEYLQRHFTLVGVVYWRKLPEMLPGLFRNPVAGDAQAFAQVRVFVPHSRLVWQHVVPGSETPDMPLGGVPGEFPGLPPDDPQPPSASGGGRWYVGRQSVPTNWSLFNQHWTAQLVPATSPNLAMILQTEPPVPEFQQQGLQVPRLGNLGTGDMRRISTH